MTQALSRSALIAYARDSIARGSKSFAMASRLFGPDTRERAWLLYAWCRRCDDLADGQDHGGAMAMITDPTARLAHIRALTESALAGEATGDPAFDGLALVAEECRIPHGLARDMVEGFALDAEGWRPHQQADLLRYCYHVAGTVGCMMALVMGVSPEDEATLDRACDLGLAFQLANIARDIAEDHEAGRCYLPAEWLTELGIPADDLLNPAYRQSLAILGRRLATLAARYEASARHGTTVLPFRSAWAVLSAAGIYGDIARQVAARGANAWDKRVSTGRLTKLGWVFRSALMAVRRKQRWPDDRGRDGLWSRKAEITAT